MKPHGFPQMPVDALPPRQLPVPPSVRRVCPVQALVVQTRELGGNARLCVRSHS